MNIHEYQAKRLLSRYAIPVPAGAVASTAEEAKRLAADLGGSSWAVKAQIHAGDRAQAGGVQVADSLDAVEQIARELLGKRLVTSQTRHQGIKVAKVYVDGREVGYSPIVMLKVKAGRRLIKVVELIDGKPGRSKSKRVKVTRAHGKGSPFTVLLPM